MSTMERIDFLQETIREQEEIMKHERERIKCLRERCAASAELICRLNEQIIIKQLAQLADAVDPFKCSFDNKTSECLAEGQNRNEEMGSEDTSDKRPALMDDEKIWPHIQGRTQVNLREQLWEIQMELKGIENKMLNGTRAQLRKWAMQLEELKRLKGRIEQAILSVESWERLFLMFMDDMDIRRHSGMDERFYQMERQDIKQKMDTCEEFYNKIGRAIEKALLRHNRERIKKFLLQNGGPDASKTCAPLSEEIKTEIRRYAIGILFLENHLFKMKRAEEKRNSAGHMLARLKEEYEIEKRWLSHMEAAY